MVITGRGGGLQHPDMKIALALGFLAFTLLAVAARLGADAASRSSQSRLRRAEEDAIDLGLDRGPRHDAQSERAAASRRIAVGGATHPDDRATTFQAVEGRARALQRRDAARRAHTPVLWVIILVWVALVWRKQAALDARLDELERRSTPPTRRPTKRGASR